MRLGSARLRACHAQQLKLRSEHIMLRWTSIQNKGRGQPKRSNLPSKAAAICCQRAPGCPIARTTRTTQRATLDALTSSRTSRLGKGIKDDPTGSTKQFGLLSLGHLQRCASLGRKQGLAQSATAGRHSREGYLGIPRPSAGPDKPPSRQASIVWSAWLPPTRILANSIVSPSPTISGYPNFKANK